MRRLLIIGCCVILLLVPLITSWTNVRHEAQSADPDAIPVLEHDWAVGDQPDLMFGLLGYPGSTYVWYGPGYFWVPIPAAFLVSLILFGFIASVYLFVSFSQRSHRLSRPPI